MFSKMSFALTAGLALLSTTVIASPDAAADAVVDKRQEGYYWHINGFQAGCANARCGYNFQVHGNQFGNDGIPFTASCQMQGLMRGDTQFRNCRLLGGTNPRVQNVQTYVELRPLQPNRPTRMAINMSYRDQNDKNQIRTFHAYQDGTYAEYQDLSQQRQFEVRPYEVAQ